jgi:hypothetical protein
VPFEGSALIKTTTEQRGAMLKSLRSPDRTLKETVWTYLVATILDDPSHNQARFLKLLCGKDITCDSSRFEPWFEAQPLSLPGSGFQEWITNPIQKSI